MNALQESVSEPANKFNKHQVTKYIIHPAVKICLFFFNSLQYDDSMSFVAICTTQPCQ